MRVISKVTYRPIVMSNKNCAQKAGLVHPQSRGRERRGCRLLYQSAPWLSVSITLAKSQFVIFFWQARAVSMNLIFGGNVYSLHEHSFSQVKPPYSPAVSSINASLLPSCGFPTFLHQHVLRPKRSMTSF